MSKVPLRAWIIWAVLFVLGVVVFNILTDSSRKASAIAYNEFLEAVEQGTIETVVVKAAGQSGHDLEISGTYTDEYVEESEKQKKFSTIGPMEKSLQDVILAKKIDLSFKKSDEDGFWQQVLLTAVPILVIVVLFIFVMRQFQGGNGKAMTFGKSRAKLLNESTNKVTFNDIAGIDEAKDELQEIVEFLKSPEKFTRLGGRIPKGVLLMGSPGTGKTLLARGVAGEADVPFFSISGSDFVEMFVGVGASRVRDLFEQAKKAAPCIIFIDEIDAVGRHRGNGMGGGHDEREQTLNQLLVEMDGFESNEHVILIAATNRPDVLDPALLRPGRFDRRVMVAPPDSRGRELILKIHTRRTPIAKNVDLQIVARGTPGFSGADLENLVNEAALQAARLDKDRVELEDFEYAKDKVLMGSERRSAVINEKERAVTAYHEAGHALVAMLQDGTDPVHKVTIIPRGRALGVTQQLPAEDVYTISRASALKRLAVMMGGRAAEKVIYDQLTTGAGNDIEVATDLARRMVCEWGMSDLIGPLKYSEGNTNPFGAGGGASSRPYSEKVAQTIDSEVSRIVNGQYDFAETLLEDNRPLLDLMADALLEFEALDTEELNLLVEFEDLDAIRRHRALADAKREENKKDRKPKSGFTSKIKEQSTLGDLKPTLET